MKTLPRAGLVLFVTKDCVGSKIMEYLSTQLAIKTSKTLVVLDSEEDQELLAAFEVAAVPTLVKLDNNSKEWTRAVGVISFQNLVRAFS
jgi:thiol:disulfide interchange protein